MDGARGSGGERGGLDLRVRILRWGRSSSLVARSSGGVTTVRRARRMPRSRRSGTPVRGGVAGRRSTSRWSRVRRRGGRHRVVRKRSVRRGSPGSSTDRPTRTRPRRGGRSDTARERGSRSLRGSPAPRPIPSSKRSPRGSPPGSRGWWRRSGSPSTAGSPGRPARAGG